MLVAPDCFRGLTEQEQRQQLYEALHGIVDHTGGEEPEPPEPEFDPSTIAGLVLWAKAYDPVTVTKDVNDAVSPWNDISGNGNHLTQGIVARRPLWRSNRINGLATITTDGVDDDLRTANFGLVPPYEIYFLGKLTDEGANLQVFFDGITAYGELYSPGNGNVRMYASADFDTGAMVQANAVHVLSFNGASSFYRTNLNAIITGNPGTANPGGLIIGADKDAVMQNAIIEICEILVYDNQLSEADRDAVCAYLMAKGAIV